MLILMLFKVFPCNIFTKEITWTIIGTVITSISVFAAVVSFVKNENIRVSVRSRGPIINTSLAKYNGGGHKYASGARIKTMADVEPIVEDLDYLCKKYNEEVGDTNESKQMLA